MRLDRSRFNAAMGPGNVTFEPLFPAHAIERCTIVIAFDAAVPFKLFDKIALEGEANLAKAGLNKLAVASGFQIDMPSGQVRRIEGGGPKTLSTADGSLQLLLTSNAIQWTSTAYFRWAPYLDQFYSSVAPLLQSFAEAVSIASVKLEYLDRFFWSGTWDDFAPEELLKLDSGFVVAAALKHARQWHSHAGWFEREKGPMRRLVNVNIDALDAVLPNSTSTRPCVGILTLTQDQPSQGSSNQIFSGDGVMLKAALTNQHEALKSLIRDIIVERMAKRIGL